MLQRMDFEITYPNGESDHFSGDNVKYRVNEYGVLLLNEGDEKTHFSPAGWLRVRDMTPKRPPRQVQVLR